MRRSRQHKLRQPGGRAGRRWAGLIVTPAMAWLAISGALAQDPKRPAALARPATAADVVTLKDGTTVLGQVANPADRGKLVMVVRRAWADEHLPERAKAWRAFEAPWLERARTERLRRLEAWRRERSAAIGADERDPILGPLGREIDRLREAKSDDLPPLLMVPIERREVAKVDRRPPDVARWLRAGWRSGIADVEMMPLPDLKGALEARNVPLAGDDPAPIDDLLPLPIEDEARWRLRRAATEVQADRSARFARHGDAIFPENANGQGLNLNALGGLGNLSGLLRELTGDTPRPDPLPATLRGVAERGGVGAVVTTLEIAPDLAGVRVESALWVREGDDPTRWRPAGSRIAQVRTDQIRADAGAAIADDPQVKAVFELADGLGLGQITPEMKQRALAIGAATQQALGQAREALQGDLDSVALTLGAGR
jgi:hypothetical protein